MALRLYFAASAFIYGVAAEVETCRENAADTDSSCSSSSPGRSASLLQKTFQRDGKGSRVLSEAEGRPECTGVTTQGKCWYLSEVGESCTATCARYGRSFSYVHANNDKPLMPQLLGREPVTKQEPWAALECHVPGDDRFHIAHENAADHMENIGNWTHPLCQLACPCGKPLSEETCSWKPAPACAPEFEWKGITVTGGCLKTVDHNKPWCLHDREGRSDAWSDCVRTCVAGEVPTSDGCKWIASPKCVAEFDFSGAHYVGCTDANHDTPWCSNSDPFTGSWNHCEDTCAKTPPTNDKLCFWKKPKSCADAFVYKGVQYSGCAEIDHPTPWCSQHNTHMGDFSKCEKVCYDVDQSNGKPSTRNISSDNNDNNGPAISGGAPCDRDDAEDDDVGKLVTLDEAGYKIAAAASTVQSPANMKRFVCRMVSKLNCEVVQMPGLIDFDKFYSGRVAKADQTYEHLESELNTLCQTGGNWIVPKSLS